MGLHIEQYIKLTEDEDLVKLSADDLIEGGAVPDIDMLGEWYHNVKAIIPSHAHLDHIGAIPFLASEFNAPVIGSPYTISVLKTILKNEKIRLPNQLRVLKAGQTIKLSKKVKVEFINTTHSTPDTVMIALHTPYGTLLYANDFKFDLHPGIGKKPDFKTT